MIHVAGTNGKGSTTAFMRAMLEAAGKRVHVYTSPHLVRFHERIRLGAPGGGRFVDEDELADALLEVEKINDGAADHPVRDHHRRRLRPLRPPSRPTCSCSRSASAAGSTRPMSSPTPLATVITPVSIDHEKFLGDTLDGDRRREGRHPQARPAGDRRAAAARRRWR